MGAPVESGQIVARKYRVDRVLGEGGMGVVVAAHHMHLDQKVAIKFLLPDALERPEIVERFAQEARAAAKIQSQHVARVFDVGELDNGSPYMVMEYLEGRDLSVEIAERGVLPIQEAIGWLLEAIEAISEAHALGIIHRDLKPANLFLAKRTSGIPIVKVLDFGISKAKAKNEQDTPALTKTATMMGTPYYMSPEQIRSSKNVDARSDVWALGVIAYELLTKALPFDGDSGASIIAAVVAEPPRDVREYRPDLPEGLAAAIMRCMEKMRENRFADVGELAAALAPFGPANAMNFVSKIESTLASRLSARPRAMREMEENENKRTVQGRAALPAGPQADAPEEPFPLAPSAAIAPVPIPIPTPAKTASSWGTSAEESASKSKSRTIAIVGAVAVVLGAAAAIAIVARQSKPAESAGGQGLVSTTQPIVEPLASAPVATAISVVTDPAPTATASAAASVASAAPTTSVAPRITKHSRSPAPTASIAAPSPSPAHTTVAAPTASADRKGSLHMGLK